MSYYTKQLLKLGNEFMEMNDADHIDPREFAGWAIRTKRWEPATSDAVSLLARDLRRALREEHFTDDQGRRVRRNHVVIEGRNGEQKAIWKHIEDADSQHMSKSLSRRRNIISGSCC